MKQNVEVLLTCINMHEQRVFSTISFRKNYVNFLDDEMIIAKLCFGESEFHFC